MRILLAEDDELLGNGIRDGLKEFQHVVDWVKNGLAAKQALETENFDVLVLDLGLPRMSGLDVLKSIRREGIDTPVLILTARESVEDRVHGLDAGADDYLVKPFDLDELAARVRALHRRRSGTTQNILTYGDIELDPLAHIVKLKNVEINLSRREFAMLQKLIENVGRVVSREMLLQTIYGWGDEIDSNTLEVHIHNLRKKLDSKMIKTIRGIGYMLALPSTDSTGPENNDDDIK